MRRGLIVFLLFASVFTLRGQGFEIRPSERWIPFRNADDVLPGSALDFSGMGFQVPR